MILRTVSFNAWSAGNRNLRHRLCDLVEDAGGPDVIACQEMKNYRGSIPGYRRVALDEGHRENANCVLFVSRRLTLVREGYVRVGGPEWVGPKHNLRHPPRVFPWAVVESQDGQRFDVMSAHRVWTGPFRRRNMGAWRAEDAALVGWVGRRQAKHPGRLMVVNADWNGRTFDLRRYGLPDLAERLRRLPGVRGVALAVKGIDGALVVNGAHVGVRKLPGRYGSDGHRPVLTTATRKEK